MSATHLVESFSLVDTNDAADHLGHDDHVSQMRLDGIGFLIGKARLLALTQLLDKTHGLSLEATGELATNPAGEQLHQLQQKMAIIDISTGYASIQREDPIKSMAPRSISQLIGPQ